MGERGKATRIAYDTVAAAYAAALPDLSHEAPLDRAMIDEVVRELPEGASVLDAGCGTGRLLAHVHAQRPSLRLVGVDLSDGMLEEASRAAHDAELVRADLAALPFDDARFDAVIAWYSVIHTPTDVESALSSVDLVPETSLVRAPRATEAHSQAILLARKRLS